MTPHPPPDLRPRLATLLGSLEHGLIERRNAVRLTLLAALAGEHTLLIGPPGTAKSELARRLHLAFAGASYFERLLTRFSVPEELFGPLSISALEQDRYERQTRGFLPEASIAFIDEVFKANSAILNALLTLLNEREFDNGAGRQRCPLISVIGATNEVPADEVGEAFFDRFLIRLPVTPVSADGFRTLLAQPLMSVNISAASDSADNTTRGLDETDRQQIAATTQTVALPDSVGALLGDLRAALIDEGIYISDRRWVKIVWLLKTAAATEGRTRIVQWDLALLPCCLAPDAERQAAIAHWLEQRLGVDQAFAPPRLTRIVEAFEAQADIEQDAEDLDYDDSGRLKFSPGVGEQVDDAKHAATAPRMTYTRRRRYGETHIGARVAQLDALVARIDRYAGELATQRAELAAHAAASLWLDPDIARRADEHLAGTAAAIESLRLRAQSARAAFLALPRLPEDSGAAPEPVVHESLPA